MTPLAGALLAAGAVAAFGLAMVGLVLGWRRDQRRYIGRDRHFERRLRRVAAPLADPAAARAQAAGTERIFAAYEHAKAGEYRFFSYGDACFLHRAEETE